MAGHTVSLSSAIILQVLVAAVAVAAGAGTGWYIGRDAFDKELRAHLGMSPDEMAERLKTVEATYAALFAQCDPLEGSERDRLIEAQEKVETLRSDINQKEAEIAKLEIQSRENVVLRKDLASKKKELAVLKIQLEEAEVVRAELAEKLQAALVEVEVSHAETHAAREETVAVRWDEFIAKAKLDICERGTKGKVEKCRETVTAAMTRARGERYRTCVSAGGAVPQLKQAVKGMKALPPYAEWIDQESKFTKDDWYVIFCDPTLPEAGPEGNSLDPGAPAGGVPRPPVGTLPPVPKAPPVGTP